MLGVVNFQLRVWIVVFQDWLVDVVVVKDVELQWFVGKLICDQYGDQEGFKMVGWVGNLLFDLFKLFEEYDEM